MKLYQLLPGILVLGSCGDMQAGSSPYLHQMDTLKASMPLLGMLSIYPCTTRKTEDGFTFLESTPFEECYKTLPQRRFRGTLIDEYEGQQFLENVTDPAAVRTLVKNSVKADLEIGSWLYGSGKVERSVGPAPPQRSRLIAIDFMGRQSAQDGRYGHFGGYQRAVVVDRVVAARITYVSSKSYMIEEFIKRPPSSPTTTNK